MTVRNAENNKIYKKTVITENPEGNKNRELFSITVFI
jgi:hypothetical protein